MQRALDGADSSKVDSCTCTLLSTVKPSKPPCVIPNQGEETYQPHCKHCAPGLVRFCSVVCPKLAP